MNKKNNTSNKTFVKTNLSLILLLFLLITNIQFTEAQFLKKLKKRAEEAAKETIARKVEEKSARKTEEVMDTILNADKKILRKKKRRKKKRRNNRNNELSEDTNNVQISKDKRKAKGKNDFVPGTDVVFSDTFKNDAIGDFPVTWNTNSSGEIVTFDGDETKWLKLSGKGQFTPDGITNIPENATFEFDLYVDDDYSFYSNGLWINFVEVKDRRKDFTQWQRFKNGKNGVRLWLHPVAAGGKEGRTSIKSYLDNSLIVDNEKEIRQFTSKNNLIHVGIWRQKNRLRVYIDGKKIWDLPRAFGKANYNAVVFNIDGTYKAAETYFYIANLRLAVAGSDMRKALLETGKFVTNDILFDVNSATIQSNSYKILDKIGTILSENPGLKLKIVGHTDSDGSADYNLKLSKKRAESIKNYLLNNYPIDTTRLQTEGKGESQPVADNATKTGKAKNRRVEFVKL